MERMKSLHFVAVLLAVLAQPFHSSACPTTISEDLRRDCHPEPGATEAACLNRGCRWCETSTPYIPFCFYDSNEDATCPSTIPIQRRIDCHPQLGASKESCEAKGCIWCSTKVSNAPWCSFPEDSPYGYSLTGQPQKTAKGWRLMLTKRSTMSLFGNDISPLAMDVEFQRKDRLRFKIYDPNSQRFEVPLKIESPATAAAETSYDIEFINHPSFQFKIIRKSTGTVLAGYQEVCMERTNEI